MLKNKTDFSCQQGRGSFLRLLVVRSESRGQDPGPQGESEVWTLGCCSCPSCGCVCPDQLKSNSPRLMDEAVLALRNLARQCSDPSATEALTKHLFAILGGELEVGTGGDQAWNWVGLGTWS